MINGKVPAGVYFPEEVPGEEFRAEILRDVSKGSIEYSILV